MKKKKKKGVQSKACTNANFNDFGLDWPSKQPQIALQISVPVLGEAPRVSGGWVCMLTRVCWVVGAWSLRCSCSGHGPGGRLSVG